MRKISSSARDTKHALKICVYITKLVGKQLEHFEKKYDGEVKTAFLDNHRHLQHIYGDEETEKHAHKCAVKLQVQCHFRRFLFFVFVVPLLCAHNCKMI